MSDTNINRRDFLRRLGVGAGVTGLALAGCTDRSRQISESTTALPDIPVDRMTLRTNPTTGYKVSILV
ncbi:MAG: twin-arginine translocation signal domain-containing protein [Duncaniella sp.]|nr:twin-arginine translocation signal domain-containing protein [Duncaniella sp.]